MARLQRLLADGPALVPLGQSQEFANRFGQFYSQELPDPVKWVLYSLPLVILGLLLLARWQAWNEERRIRRLSSTYLLNNPAKIRAILGEACDQHVKVFVRFQRQGPGSRFTAPALVSRVGKSRLELSVSQGLSDDWVGRGLECFFLLPNPEHAGILRKYGFAAEVTAVRPAADSLDLNLPRELSDSDRREFLRLPLTREMGVAGRLWRVKILSSGAFDVTPNTWGPPLVDASGGREDRVDNLSGGGFRLTVRDRGASFDTGDLFFFRLDLPGADGKPMILVFVAAVRHTRRQGGMREIGFAFVHHARRRPGESRLEWQRVSEEFGVDLAARWVQQQEQTKVRRQHQIDLDR